MRKGRLKDKQVKAAQARNQSIFRRFHYASRLGVRKIPEKQKMFLKNSVFKYNFSVVISPAML